jgi:peroxiredoxin
VVRTASTMTPLGSHAPDFELPNTNGKLIKLSDFSNAKAMVVIFMCNHCPYVKHVAPEIVRVWSDYVSRGVAFVGINSNDAEKYPDDGPDKMKEEATKQGYRFPYLYDESQSVAEAYNAACTPDFFVFDRDRRLVYRGQLDDSRPKSDKALSGRDLRRALDNILNNQPVSTDQRPSVGCNIKWKEGAEPKYFDPAGVAG